MVELNLLHFFLLAYATATTAQGTKNHRKDAIRATKIVVRLSANATLASNPLKTPSACRIHSAEKKVPKDGVVSFSFGKSQRITTSQHAGGKTMYRHISAYV